MRKLYAILFMVTAMTACQRESDVTRLKMALELSGVNRAELEKVLDNYSQTPETKLKLKAAEFLIANMPGHYAVGGKAMEQFRKSIDSSLWDRPTTIKTMYYLIATRKAIENSQVILEPDIEHITADFLIDNIERSFEIWNKFRAHYELSFEDFCEYILPYRVSCEPLTAWKDSTMLQCYDFTSLERYTFETKMLESYIKYIINLDNGIRPSLLDNPALQQHTLDCIDIANNEMLAMRYFGLPTVIDFTPHYPTKENRHYWVSIIDKRYVNDNASSFLNPYTAKVYRKTYSLQPVPNDRLNAVPGFMRDPHKKDVTELYENIASIEYDFGKVPKGCTYAYLAVFNNQQWQEIAWSRMRRGKACFEKMGRDVIYLPTYYNSSMQVKAQYPIHLRTDGKIVEMKPDKEHTQDIILRRKFTYNTLGDYSGRNLLDSKVLATDDIKTMRFDTLASFDRYNFMQYDSVGINTSRKYKYWVIKGGQKYTELASVLFLDKNGQQAAGTPFSIDVSGLYSEDGPHKIFDDDILTSAHLTNMVGIRCDRPQSVTTVKYLTRNDGNGIYPGEEYELLYFDSGQWVSLGRQIAKTDHLIYPGVPTKALFWLRNLTKGKEERPFTACDGKIRYW